MKQLLRRPMSFLLATVLLAALIVLTLPVSYAVWREVLGVGAGVDVDQGPTATPTVTLVTPTMTSTITPTSTATVVPSLPVIVITQVIPNTPVASTNNNSPATVPVVPTNLPPTEFSPPTDLVPTEPPPTEPPATAEPAVTEPAPTEPPVEFPTEAPSPVE
jgi:hypothetical protein